MVRKLLFLANYCNDKAPGQRYRFEQYLTCLAESSFEIKQSALFTIDDVAYIHKPGYIIQKTLLAVRSLLKRAFEALSFKKYSAIFVYREALFWGPPIFEWLIQKINLTMILDFDDAIWLYDSNGSSFKKYLRYPHKTAKIISYSDLVIVGNEYLADYCRKNGAKKIEVVPSTIDTDKYVPNYSEHPDVVTIGWTGSPSTIPHFESCMGALKKIKSKYGDRLDFRLIGDPDFESLELNIHGLPWISETEVQDLYPMDIGIMPLPDDEWTRGKCGMKGLQYMALEIPTVMSPVGVNKKIIQDGENGFLANSEDEWVQKLSLLIENYELRLKLGKAGRRTVVENYSVASQKDRYVKIFEDLINA